MYIALSDIVVFTLLLAIAIFWWNLQDIRRIAYPCAKQHCQKRGLQLLDSNVSWSLKGVKRNKNGMLAPVFVCTFEFSSTGNDRYQGAVYMLGKQVTKVDLSPYRIHNTGEPFL